MTLLRLPFGHQPSVCRVRQDSGVAATGFMGWAWRSRAPPAARFASPAPGRRRRFPVDLYHAPAILNATEHDALTASSTVMLEFVLPLTVITVSLEAQLCTH